MRTNPTLSRDPSVCVKLVTNRPPWTEELRKDFHRRCLPFGYNAAWVVARIPFVPSTGSVNIF
ncbi:hypothetical protein SAMN05444955_11529 [Lihuaxuella thermophila]|uniref:Uncharacterized protein n=1 Tax=Lihuaxuella thermophila TaxID=1173111 RepID=A0A1H8HT12_9BACL|nr:hypothetical protein SAMN05444955_11529 [Lihuaxuella thermophila]